MNENDNKLEPGVVSKTEDFLADVKDIKQNMVSKKDYEQLESENLKLRKAVLTGLSDEEPVAKRTAAEIRQDYIKGIKSGVSNLQGFTNLVDLRKAVIAETGQDPFMTEALTKIDPNFGERVAEGLTTMIENSEGSPEIFNAYFAQKLR